MECVLPQWSSEKPFVVLQSLSFPVGVNSKGLVLRWVIHQMENGYLGVTYLRKKLYGQEINFSC